MASATRVLRSRTSGVREDRPPQAAQEIAKVAYELFEQRGRIHGRDQEDWFEAERIVSARRRGNGRG